MSAARQTPSSDQLLLSIGGLVGHLELVGAPWIFVQQVRERYHAFLLPVAPSTTRDFSLRLAMTSPARPRKGQRPWETRPLEVTTSEREISIERWDLSARLTAPAGGRRAQRAFRGEGRCELTPFAIDCILRVLWAALLPKADGMLVHGCGLRHAEIGYVFAGQSGAGKTTLARKAPDADDVLSDELCVVRRTDDGWRVYGTPFWGDFARGGISMRGWPLRTLGFLSQSRDGETHIEPITSADAALRLLGCFLAMTTDASTVQRNLALAIRLCEEVRAVEACLTKPVPAADVFRKLGPHLGPDVDRRAPVANPRELISDFKALLRKHGKYASLSKGTSMRPWLKPGDSLFVQTVLEDELVPGDVLIYWKPGATPEDDMLVCHRLVSRTADARAGFATYVTKGDATSHFERFRNGGAHEILGKIVAVARDGQTRPLPGRLGSLARLFGSLAVTPVLRMVGR